MKSNAHGRPDTYTNPDQQQGELLRSLREQAEKLRDTLAAVEQHVMDQHQHAKVCDDFAEMERLDSAAPFEWIAQARMALRSGFMFAERALQQPATF